MPTAMDPERRRRHLDMLSSPGRWQHWPLLPLVRCRPGQVDCGLLCDPDALPGRPDGRVTVFLGNLFLLPADPYQFLELPKETFGSFDELLAAGWVVD